MQPLIDPYGLFLNILAVQEDRMQTVASLVSRVQDLMDQLKISVATDLDKRIQGSLAIPSSSGAPALQTTEVRKWRII